MAPVSTVVPRRPAMRVAGATKRYRGIPALDGVELSIEHGAIHALAGSNGSGKSTLIKLLAGVEQADGGTVTVGERTEPLAHLGPQNSRALGLRFVHQHPGIFGDLTVAENFGFTLDFPLRAGGIDWRRLRRRTSELLDRYEIMARPDQLARELRPAAQTMLAIARALADEEGGDRILVLDEPTASLPAHEVDVLLEALSRRARLGQTILYVSHRLSEVKAIASDITVLRDGVVVADRSVEGLSQHDMVELMAGEPLEDFYPPIPEPVADPRPLLEISGLTAGPLRDVRLAAHGGQILGIAGLLGSGRSTLLRSIFGALPTGASVVVDGREFDGWSMHRALEQGIALVPEDRPGEALFSTMSVVENATIAALDEFSDGPQLRRGREAAAYADMSDRLKVKAASPELPITGLSGGNQQKVILGRWLQRSPAVVLLDEPAQGVDAMARAEIYHLLRSVASEGRAVIIASSDYEELSNLCDRVVVLRDGRIVADLTHDEASIPTLIEYSNTPATAEQGSP
ncbi:sugar ABC transporter ATP-binding protein [Leucobacter weissii]|uniref:Sugar ABC transporter ATP-binding protein n=1 Tax=Leucobacter weissii TaxID=1983706 RepID=A0A939MJ95_9MICO|nr:sugar ABC transporter ATP-binding protein [Leucobacter weissii]MBO1901763.1 sugar ABC transporter ATP-binding protein [Leucobacter weissii]